MTAEQCAMLDELAKIAMAVARALGKQVAATGQAGGKEAVALVEVMRAVRRTCALRHKLLEDSRMTDAERAAARARRDEAQEIALRRARRQDVRETRRAEVRGAVAATILADAVERRAPAAETEQQLLDVNERLLDDDIARSFGVKDNSVIILGICKDLSITPRKETWSHRLMQLEIASTTETLRRFEDGLKDRGVSTGSALPPTPAGLGRGPGPGGSYPKIGRFNFGPTGAIESVDPPDRPLHKWEMPMGIRPPDSG